MAIACSFFFKGVDEEGNMYENDRVFHEREASRGLKHLLKTVCGIEDIRATRLIEDYYESLQRGNRDLKDDTFQ
jgi:hypothetical protein